MAAYQGSSLQVSHRPSLFIGSSVEGLPVAYAIQENLEFDCEPTVWPQGVFQPTGAALVDLYARSRQAEFAVFVFTPDDVVQLRGQKFPAVRDNVIFELGLFVGALGPRRCFVVMPHGGDLHLPSDLVGLELLRYVANRQDGNLRAALGPACNKVREALRLEPSAVPTAASEAPRVAETADQRASLMVDAWDSDPLVQARKVLRAGIPFHISEDADGLATDALSLVYSFLNSMADGVLAGHVNEDMAKSTFQQAVAETWSRAFGYFVPPGGDPEEAWTPMPPLGVLAARWGNVT